MCAKLKVVAMAFRTGQGRLKHNFCRPCYYNEGLFNHETPELSTEPALAIFNSKIEAEKAGWLLTSDPKWCPCHLPVVWVCPDCIADQNRGKDQ